MGQKQDSLDEVWGEFCDRLKDVGKHIPENNLEVTGREKAAYCLQLTRNSSLGLEA